MTTQPDLKTTIRIEVAPDGLHITCEYVNTLASIPAAVERLRAAGILDLVQASRPAAPAAKPNGCNQDSRPMARRSAQSTIPSSAKASLACTALRRTIALNADSARYASPTRSLSEQ